MNLVVDASVAIKWIFPDRPGEADVDRAMAILASLDSQNVVMVQPPIFLVEVLAVVARFAPTHVPVTLSRMLNIGFNTVDNRATYLRAADLAIRLNHHFFDTLYHAVALEMGATLVTADERYFAKARG